MDNVHPLFQNILKAHFPEPSKPVCDGACEEHVGPVLKVEVEGWGTFDYCETAIAEDESRGLTVTVLDVEL